MDTTPKKEGRRRSRPEAEDAQQPASVPSANDNNTGENFNDTTETLYSEVDTEAGKKTPEKNAKTPPGYCTPALQRLYRTLGEINVRSPSDSLMSPCTQVINKGRTKNTGPASTGSLRKREPPAGRALNFDDSDDNTDAEKAKESEE